ncbi:MAG: hypothetical protein HY581_05120 [Nitrospirae bacterium]|nr:hypothetical protein [Nitrospirota bacterium]
MKHMLHLAVTVMFCAGLASTSMAGEKGAKSGKAGNDLKSMSQGEQIKLALSAAPSHIAKEAAVMLPGADGKLVELKKGTNGFTCIPTVNNRPDPDPMCFDAAVGQWVEALQNNAPKPTNTVPGISYMARGGMHWEKDGKVLMNEEPGAKLVKEPPHWMMMWPFDSMATKLPTVPNPSGVWIMFDGTPSAHLMVYQDPMKMKSAQ